MYIEKRGDKTKKKKEAQCQKNPPHVETKVVQNGKCMIPSCPKATPQLTLGKRQPERGLNGKKIKNKVLQKLSTVQVKGERAESITKFKVGTVDSFPWRRRGVGWTVVGHGGVGRYAAWHARVLLVDGGV
jgi:hypothetical protein